MRLFYFDNQIPYTTACNDDRFLDLDVVDGAADEGGEGEIQKFASECQ